MLYTILVNWNGAADSIACATSLLASDHGDLTLVICDNDSADDSVAMLTKWADQTLVRAEAPMARPKLERAGKRTEWVAPNRPGFRFVLLENRDNYGFAGGNNVGIALALADPACRYVFVLNNDTEVAPDALNLLEARAESDPKLAVVGATLVYYDKPDTVQGLGCRYDRKDARAVTLFAGEPLADLPPRQEVEPQLEYIIGAAMFIRADVLRRTGGLSEDYFLYYEELDFSQKLLPDERLGWEPRAVIRHKVGGSIGTGLNKRRPSNISLYYDHRSKLRFYRKFWPKMLPFLAIRIAKTMLAYLRKGDVKAVTVIARAIGDNLTKPASYRPKL